MENIKLNKKRMYINTQNDKKIFNACIYIASNRNKIFIIFEK